MLEVGTGSGYGAAVLSREAVAILGEMLARQVDDAERDGDRFFDAEQNARLVAEREAPAHASLDARTPCAHERVSSESHGALRALLLQRPDAGTRASAGEGVMEFMSSLGQRLRAEHQSLDALFNDIADRVHLGETTDIDAGWSTLEATLLKHMDFEEREILPRLGHVDPREAERIREEHAQIRSTLTELGIAIELHILRENTVREFLGMLRAHAAREDRSLYPLVDNDAANVTQP